MAKGWSFGALTDVVYPCNYPDLGSNGPDLNSFSSDDSVGIYRQVTNANATAAKNYPVNKAGTLEVLPCNSGGTMQRYTSMDGDMFWRRYYSNAWSAWDRFFPASQIYQFIYPVGINLLFSTNANPNTLFPGTTWVQQTGNQVIRAATNTTVGTASGNIGETGGADSYGIAIANLPSHTHSIAQHTHTMAHTHSMNHDHSNATAASAGAHTHPVGGYADGGSPGFKDMSNSRTPTGFNTGSAGAHTHTVDIPTFNGNTGDSSAGSTGNGGPTATGAVGSGTALSVTNPFRRYAIWQRTA